MNRLTTIAGVLFAAVASGGVTAQTVVPAPAGDPVMGSQLVQMCQGCHGIPGWRTAFPEVYKVPKISGQNPGYLVSALKAYKTGERTHPSMRAIAATLSESDMAHLAAYYAQAPVQTAAK